jgi:hypothetical protein
MTSVARFSSRLELIFHVKEVQRIATQIRKAWPHTQIILRADSGFCHEELMA